MWQPHIDVVPKGTTQRRAALDRNHLREVTSELFGPESDPAAEIQDGADLVESQDQSTNDVSLGVEAVEARGRRKPNPSSI